MAAIHPRVDAQTAAAVGSFLKALAGRYDVASARLFGSRARGDHRVSSDADVAVFLRGRPGACMHTALDMADVAYTVMLKTGILIQPLPIWLEEWANPQDHTNPRLLQNIERDGVTL